MVALNKMQPGSLVCVAHNPDLHPPRQLFASESHRAQSSDHILRH